MRAPLSTLTLLRPRTVAAALAHMAEAPRPTPIAGGTDLYVALNAGAAHARVHLDLSRLAAWRGITTDRNSATIGALTTFAAIRAHAVLRRRLPSLVAAAAEVGAWQIQARATLGGNIANASPAGDSLPVLLAHDATVTATSLAGSRAIAFAELYTGYRALALEPGELISAIHIPFPPRGATAFFRKVGTRRAQSISKVVVSAVLALDTRGRVAHVRLAYGSMAPTTVRANHAEAAIIGQRPRTAIAAARAALTRDLSPIDDIRSEREYRMQVAANLLEQCLRAAGA